MTEEPRYAEIDSSRVPVAGLGGIGMLAAAVFVVVFLPEVRPIVIGGLVSGLVLGAALILWRRYGRSR